MILNDRRLKDITKILRGKNGTASLKKALDELLELMDETKTTYSAAEMDRVIEVDGMLAGLLCIVRKDHEDYRELREDALLLLQDMMAKCTKENRWLAVDSEGFLDTVLARASIQDDDAKTERGHALGVIMNLATFPSEEDLSTRLNNHDGLLEVVLHAISNEKFKRPLDNALGFIFNICASPDTPLLRGLAMYPGLCKTIEQAIHTWASTSKASDYAKDIKERLMPLMWTFTVDTQFELTSLRSEVTSLRAEVTASNARIESILGNIASSLNVDAAHSNGNGKRGTDTEVEGKGGKRSKRK